MRANQAPEQETDPFVRTGRPDFAAAGAWRDAARHLGALLVPAAVVMALVSVAVIVSTSWIVGRDGLFVNGDLAPIVPGGVSFVVWDVVLLLVGVLGWVVAVAAGVVMTAGVLLGVPVAPGAALRVAVRRLPSIAGVVVVASLVVAAAVAIGWFAAGAVPTWVALATTGIVLLVALPYAVVLPATLLESRGIVRAFRRAHRVVSHRRTRIAVKLLVGAAVPVVLARGVVQLVEGLVGPFVERVLQSGVHLAAVVLPAAVLAVVFLNPRETDESADGFDRPVAVDAPRADRELIRAGLTEISSGPPSGGRFRSLLLIGVVLLPALLSAVLMRVNPLSLAVVSDHNPVAGFDAHTFVGKHLRLHYDAAGRPIPLFVRTLTVLACADIECSRSEVVDDGFSFDVDLPSAASASLPDGRIAVAAWIGLPGATTGLQLFGCDADGCDTGALDDKPVLRESKSARRFASAVAARPDGGIVVAHTAPLDHDVAESVLRLTTCAGLDCTQRRTVALTRLPTELLWLDTRPLEVAVAPDGTATAAYLDPGTGAVTIATCDTELCQNPTVTTPVTRAPAPDLEEEDALVVPHGVDVAVRDDGTPVVAYRDFRTGAARLLICGNRDCTTIVRNVTLTGPGQHRPRPVLALDHEGHPLIATYDLADDRLVLIRCDDAMCTRPSAVPLAAVQVGPGPLDIALTPDGRPQIYWVDTDTSPGPGPPTRLRLITCAAADCR